MPVYVTDYAKAARRTWAAAEALPKTCQAVKGYLYGIAAECAVKACMRRAGLTELAEDRRNDPYFAHYPYLANQLKERIVGRGQSDLARYAQTTFLQDWNTDMRYSDGSQITSHMVSKWRDAADRAVADV